MRDTHNIILPLPMPEGERDDFKRKDELEEDGPKTLFDVEQFKALNDSVTAALYEMGFRLEGISPDDLEKYPIWVFTIYYGNLSTDNPTPLSREQEQRLKSIILQKFPDLSSVTIEFILFKAVRPEPEGPWPDKPEKLLRFFSSARSFADDLKVSKLYTELQQALEGWQLQWRGIALEFDANKQWYLRIEYFNPTGDPVPLKPVQKDQLKTIVTSHFRELSSTRIQFHYERRPEAPSVLSELDDLPFLERIQKLNAEGQTEHANEFRARREARALEKGISFPSLDLLPELRKRAKRLQEALAVVKSKMKEWTGEEVLLKGQRYFDEKVGKWVFSIEYVCVIIQGEKPKESYRLGKSVMFTPEQQKTLADIVYQHIPELSSVPIVVVPATIIKVHPLTSETREGVEKMLS